MDSLIRVPIVHSGRKVLRRDVWDIHGRMSVIYSGRMSGIYMGRMSEINQRSSQHYAHRSSPLKTLFRLCQREDRKG